MKNFLALILFAGGFAAWYFYNQKKESNEGLEAAQSQVADLEKAAVIKRSEFQAAESAMAIRAKVTARKDEIKTLQNKLQALIDSRRSIEADKLALLTAIRQKFIGSTIPLVLAGGRNLGQVRIMKMEDAAITVATTSGVVKVLPNELPPELRGQFLYTF
jgi:hypothetical protein